MCLHCLAVSCCFCHLTLTYAPAGLYLYLCANLFLKPVAISRRLFACCCGKRSGRSASWLLKGKGGRTRKAPDQDSGKDDLHIDIYRVAIRSAKVAQTAKEGGEGRFGKRPCFFQEYTMSLCMSALPLITSSLITWYSRINESETATNINFNQILYVNQGMHRYHMWNIFVV